MFIPTSKPFVQIIKENAGEQKESTNNLNCKKPAEVDSSSFCNTIYKFVPVTMFIEN